MIKIMFEISKNDFITRSIVVIFSESLEDFITRSIVMFSVTGRLYN